MARVVADGPHFHEVIRVEQHQVSDDADWLGGVIQHVETWNPDRVLAECEAKREILDVTRGTYSSDLVRRLLALPYADRPGYREEWRP